jgi:diketogulonate reductase-like aldo/keto reductase
MSTGDIPLRPFGRHAERVSALGLGGFHVGKLATEREAIRLVHAAIDAGITLYKTTAQHDGVEGRAQHGFPSEDEMGG